jgi:hypothetical protein
MLSSSANATVAPCEVCYRVDADQRQKAVVWCGKCQAFICGSCLRRPLRRFLALVASKLGKDFTWTFHGPLPLLLLGLLLIARPVGAQSICGPGLQTINSLNTANNAGQIYQNACWNPATNQLTFPNTPAGIFSYSWFGNTANPLTALVDPTTVTDTAGNDLAFSSTGVVLTDLFADGFTFASGTATMQDDASDSIQMFTGETFLSAAGINNETMIAAGTTFNQPVTVNLSALGTPLPTPPAGTLFNVTNTTGNPSRIAATAFGSTAFHSSVAYAGTITAPTAVTSSTQIGGFNGWAYNGTTLNGPIAAFRVFANQTQTPSAAGSYADIATTPNGATTEAQVVRFENDGGITVPATVTGGDKGAGTINAGGLFVNGNAVNTSTSNVASVSNTDGTLTITPTTGAVVGSLALGHANTWTGQQTFNVVTPTTISSSPNVGAVGGTSGTFTYLGSTSGSLTVGCFTATCGQFGAPGTGTAVSFAHYIVNGNCASAASPAVCSAFNSGDSVIAAGSTSVVINTSGIDANSQVFLTPTDATSVGTRLSVTCNSTLTTLLAVLGETARTAGTSFTVSTGATTVATNPLCFHWFLIN